MICDNCGKDHARVRRVTRGFGVGETTFFIENVPVVTCTSCNESYLEAETLQEIERIRLHWRQLTVVKSVPVARFEDAA